VGLYLCVFDGDEDVDGIDVGMYEDWNAFIKAIVSHLEGGQRGSRFPLLTLHQDCDGEWSPSECVDLEKALDEIAREFEHLPSEPPRDGWKADIAKRFGLQLGTLHDCFFDVDGESLIGRLRGLAKLAQKINRPIIFQ
jgi:hypothetical protein